MPMIPPRVKPFLLPISIAISVLTFAYSMRHVPVPPDCILDPENTACMMGEAPHGIALVFFAGIPIAGVVVMWFLAWKYEKRHRGRAVIERISGSD